VEEGNGSEAKGPKSDRNSDLGIASFVLALIAIGVNTWMIAPLFSHQNRQSLAFA